MLCLCGALISKEPTLKPVNQLKLSTMRPHYLKAICNLDFNYKKKTHTHILILYILYFFLCYLYLKNNNN